MSSDSKLTKVKRAQESPVRALPAYGLLLFSYLLVQPLRGGAEADAHDDAGAGFSSGFGGGDDDEEVP